MSNQVTTNLQVRIDQKTKKEVQKILEGLGLDMTTAVKMLFKQIQRTQRLPFEVGGPVFMTKKSERVLEKSLQNAKRSKKSFSSAQALIDDLLT